METGVRMQTIGNIEQLPASCIKTLEDTVEITKNNSRITLVLALNYSGRWDIIEAVRKIAAEVKAGNLEPENISQEDLNTALNTAPYPNPDLLIRTSGEQRISNFLLWEIAYSEIYFTNVLWPEFSTEDFYRAIIDYQGRERRFGKTGEQIGQVK
jgi:undecaprenyl diphosphate synthase